VPRAMEVDAGNFEEALALFLECLPTTSFIALDLEMTGINVGAEHDDKSHDTAEQRYTKKRRAAASYGIIQVGLCLFQHASTPSSARMASSSAGRGQAGGQELTARPFNFFIFPRPINEPPDCYISPKVSLDADAMHFVRCSGVDFGRWMSSGIPYLDRQGEDQLRAALARRLEAPAAGPEKGKAHTDEVMRREAKGIEEVSSGKCFGPGASYCMKGKPGRHTLLVQAMRERRPKDHIVLERRPGPLGGCRLPVVTMRNLGPDPAALEAWRRQEAQEAERFALEHAGFRRVWQALLRSGRPLVLHNGLLDLLFAYHWLEEPLPESLDEFKGVLRRTLAPGTRIYDTKWIAHNTDIGVQLQHGQRTGLEVLMNLVEEQQEERVRQQQPSLLPQVTCPEGFDRYEGSSPSYHEAAYDALCTGKLFAYFCRAGDFSLCQELAAPPTGGAGRAQRASGSSGGPVHCSVGANRFGALHSSEESSDSNGDSGEASGPPAMPTLADADNKVFLMMSKEDLSWGSAAPKGPPPAAAPVLSYAPTARGPLSTAPPLAATAGPGVGGR